MSGSSFGKYLFNAIFAGVLARTTTILKTELEHAKNEIQAKLKGLGIGFVLLGVASTFAFFALGVLLIAAVFALSLVWPLWLSALVIGGGLLLIGVIFIAAGVSKIKKNKDLMPERAINNIKSVFNK